MSARSVTLFGGPFDGRVMSVLAGTSRIELALAIPAERLMDPPADPCGIDTRSAIYERRDDPHRADFVGYRRG